MPDAPPRRAEPLDLVAFLATAVASFVLRWNLADLVWGLWLSSLLIGYALIVYGILAAVWRPLPAGTPLPDGKPDLTMALGQLPSGVGTAIRLFGAVFMLAFFTVHFGGFHLVHGIFLGVFFPLQPGEPPFESVLSNAGHALAGSWPLVVTSAVSMRDAFAEARREFKAQTPYLNVIRMHFLIFVFAGASIAKLDSRWLYIVVLFFYFFPFKVLKASSRGVEQERGIETSNKGVR